MKKLILILFFPVGLYAQSGPLSFSSVDQSELIGQLNGTPTAFSFLRISPDARAGGMGDGSVALSNDANAMYWNSSRLAFNKKRFGFAASYAPWLRALVPDVNHFYTAAYFKPDSVSAIGVSCTYFSFGSISSPMWIPWERGWAMVGDISYSRKLRDHISAGLTARFIQSANYPVYQFDSRGVAADVGLSWMGNECSPGKWSGHFQSGLAITNIGPKVAQNWSGNSDFLPTNLALAFGGEFNKKETHFFAFQLEANKLLVPSPPIYAMDSTGNPIYQNGNFVIQSGKDPNRPWAQAMLGSFNDSPYGLKGELKEIILSCGVEYDYKRIVKLRSGIFYEHEDNGNRKFVSFGIGARYKAIAADFSYWLPLNKNRSPLEHTMKFTLLINFNSLRKVI